MALPFSQHIEQNVRVKLKTEKEKAMYSWMADAFETLGVEGYHLGPREIIANLEHKEYKDFDKFKEAQWLEFISHPVIAKYLENEILKLNSVSLRQKLVSLSRSEQVSQADVKLISILKEIVDEARNAQEDSVIHFSTFYPPRYNQGDEPEFPEYRQAELKNLIGYLGIDSDYMKEIDLGTFLEKEAEKKAKIDSIKRVQTVSQKIAQAKAEKQKKQTKFDKLKLESLDEVE